MKKILLATVSALGLAALSTPAQAQEGWTQGWSGILSGDYNYTNYKGYTEDYLEANGTAAVPLFADVTLQGHAEGQFLVGGQQGDAWSIGTFDGTMFWSGPDMRVAVTIQKELWEDFNPWTAELGGEYYLSPDITLALKGGVTWNIYRSSYGSRGNFGGQVTYYCDPNVALSLSFDNWVTPY
ncbi:MAG: hypothetical protein JOZ55_08095, partial [Alphaproteobacteria bacterium]|nr:hypothetical protein [Alphaproteobacteria bacterium]